MYVVRKTAFSCSVRIWLAGDPARAEDLCMRFCWDIGLCVTVTPTTFVYSGGMERGVMVGLVNYPRFPKSAKEIRHYANLLAIVLRDGLHQKTCLVETPEETIWLKRDLPFEGKEDGKM